MSGLGSLIGTAFKAVGAVASKVSSAVVGVGKAVFSTGAATATAPLSMGGFSNLGLSGTMGSIISGAVKQAAVGALVGGAIGAVTGQGFGKGALIGGLGGAVTGGISGAMSGGGLLNQAATNAVPAETATGMAPAGAAPSTAGAGNMAGAPMPSAARFGYDAAPAAAQPSTVVTPAQAAPSSGFSQFLQNNGGSILQGLGQGAGAYLQSQSAAEEKQKDRDFLAEKDARISASYDVPSDGRWSGDLPNRSLPTPRDAFARTVEYRFDATTGAVERVKA